MKMIIAFAALVAVTLAAPQQQVDIVQYKNDITPEGSYSFQYELTDGQKREEKGTLKNAGSENESMDVQGSYSFVGPDGVLNTVTFIADENGFRPQVTRGGQGK